MIVSRAAFAAAVLTSVLIGCGDDTCDEDAIRETLAEAMPGDTVEVGACTIQGGFVVRDGVTLRGEGRSVSTIDSGAADVAITFEGGGRGEVRDLFIFSAGRAAILSRGPGERVLTNVGITVSRGVGVAIEGASVVEMSQVAIAGPITSATAPGVPSTATPMTHATHGLLLVSVANAVLSEVSVSGFAKVGALFSSSTVSWNDGSASDNLALGLGVESGDVILEDVAASRTLQGTLLLPAYGAVFTANATVATTRLHLIDNQGFGFLQHTGRGSHSAVDASGNDNAAAWAQSVERFDLTGTFVENKFAGVVLVDAMNAVVHDARIDETIGATRVIEGLPYVVGDGVQLVRSVDTTVLRDLTLSNNERAGVLAELGGQTITAATLDRITVTVTNMNQKGVVAQNGPKDANWDSGVTRIGTNSQQDAAAGTLQSVEAVGPCNRPIESQLATNGLASLIGI